MKVRDIMTAPALTCAPAMSVAVAVRRMGPTPEVCRWSTAGDNWSESSRTVIFASHRRTRRGMRSTSTPAAVESLAIENAATAG
jgi:hypothetical protein